MTLRCNEVAPNGLAWHKIGVDGRRSLWVRFTHPTMLELCAGREGDDDYVSIDASNPKFAELYDLMLSALYAADVRHGDLQAAAGREAARGAKR